jgi:hypothetical protein
MEYTISAADMACGSARSAGRALRRLQLHHPVAAQPHGQFHRQVREQERKPVTS